MATERNGYLISEAMVTRLFVGSVAVMLLALVALLLIATARPQGSLRNVNTSQFEASRSVAQENLTGYRETEDGRITIDIRRAMELTVERGLD